MKNLQRLIFILTLLSTQAMAQSIYDFKIPALNGKDTINFAEFKGKKIVVVNTASECGYTPQYAPLQDIYKLHSDKVVIVALPANNYGGQEPGSGEEIKSFCTKNYGVTFPISTKMSVDGKDIHPFAAWLISLINDGDKEIKWNFEKFVFDEHGKYIAHFRSRVNPSDEVFLHSLGL